MRHLRLLASQSVKEFSDDNCTQMAAAISYYVLFSLFPLLIFSIGLLGVVLQNSDLQDDIIEAILDYFPLDEQEGRNEVTEAVRSIAGAGSGALGLLGLLGMAWSGSNMFGVIRRSLNAAYDIEFRRPLVRQKLLDLAMVLAFAPFFLISLAVTAALRIARHVSEDAPLLGEISSVLGPGWDLASLLLPIGVSFVAFSVLYSVVPATKISARDVWPGALLAAVLFELTKVGFSIYLENFSNYDAVFGSLGAVVAFLFWVYLGANVLLLGAEVASEYPRVMRGEYDVPEPEARKPVPLRARVKGFLRGLVLHEDEGSSQK